MIISHSESESNHVEGSLCVWIFAKFWLFPYLIVEGRVDVSVAIPGSNSHEPIATLEDGEVVGEMILLGRERRSAQVTAKDAVKAIVWKREDMVGLFEKDNVIGFKVMRQLASLLADRLISTNLVLRNVLTVPRTIFM